MKSEAAVQSEIIKRAFELGFALWRNNSGVSTEEHRPVRFGVGNDSSKINKTWKSSDLIGVGPHGRALWVEVKHEGWVFKGDAHETAQTNAINDVNSRGGIAFFCTSVEHFEATMKGLM